MTMKVYGPYTRKDGRQHVCLVEEGTRKTVSYPKYLAEQYLGRPLRKDEVVHHKDGNPSNNIESNLEILLRKEHPHKHPRPTEMLSFCCPMCNTKFKRSARRIKGNQEKQKKAGPFCSKSCAGKLSPCSTIGSMHRT